MGSDPGGFFDRKAHPVTPDRPSVAARGAAQSGASLTGATRLLRLADGPGPRAWFMKEFVEDKGAALMDRRGQPVCGPANANTRERVLEALNLLFEQGQLHGVGGFSYHGSHRVAVVTETGVQLDWP